MRRKWILEDLIESWSLTDDDRRLLANKSGVTRLGFALMVKFFEIEARFPERHYEFPSAAAEFVAKQIRIDVRQFTPHQSKGRTVEYHRAQIRAYFGFREATRADEEALSGWLADEVCPSELNEVRQKEALLARCRAEHIEPPGRIDRIINSANAAADERFVATTVARLCREPGVVDALESIIAPRHDAQDAAEAADGARRSFFTELKDDPATKTRGAMRATRRGISWKRWPDGHSLPTQRRRGDAGCEWARCCGNIDTNGCGRREPDGFGQRRGTSGLRLGAASAAHPGRAVVA